MLIFNLLSVCLCNGEQGTNCLIEFASDEYFEKMMQVLVFLVLASFTCWKSLVFDQILNKNSSFEMKIVELKLI